MEHSNLYNLINCLEYGTKLHIGVLFFGSFGNEKCALPPKHQIHPSIICEEFKGRGDKGFKRCYTCRNLAIQKALTDKKPFGGLCINGVYEYTHPVVIGGEVACMIFIGNILEGERGRGKISKNLDGKKELFDTMEKDFSSEKCQETAMVIESYIRVLLEKYSRFQSEANPVIENIKSYINANLEFDIEISRLAEIFHYNEKYMGRLFKKETGQSIREYVSSQRLKRAKYLLEHTNDSVIAVSTSVGFNNVTYFNRIFKKTFGTTPSCHRTGQKEHQY